MQPQCRVLSGATLRSTQPLAVGYDLYAELRSGLALLEPTANSKIQAWILDLTLDFDRGFLYDVAGMYVSLERTDTTIELSDATLNKASTAESE